VGALATTSDGIPIYLEPLHDFSASYYNYMAVDAHYGGWGSGMVIQTNNITAQFDIGSVVPVTDTVCIAFRDEGGFENIWINGAPPLTGPNGYGGPFSMASMWVACKCWLPVRWPVDSRSKAPSP
jgi:hypothetical protein